MGEHVAVPRFNLGYSDEEVLLQEGWEKPSGKTQMDSKLKTRQLCSCQQQTPNIKLFRSTKSTRTCDNRYRETWRLIFGRSPP